VLITLGVILYIAMRIWAKEFYEAYPAEVSMALGGILSLGLVYLLFFEKKPYGQPSTRVIADKLGWVPDPRFRRKALSALPEEQEIRAWRNLRVGLSLKEASYSQHGRHLGEIQITVQFADPSAPGGIESVMPASARDQILAEIRQRLEALGLHPQDRVELNKGKLDIRLALWGREMVVEAEGKRELYRLGESAVKNQFPLVFFLALKTWEAVRPVIERRTNL
jgi:hypothetical protein